VRRPEYAACKLLAAVSDDVEITDNESLLWGVFTRFDCARDIVPAAVETRGAWLTCRGPLGIDATWKDGYPEPVASPPEVIAKVDGWWGKE
jgi:4-hydroxy-3-polyprenylbenzoate decarboxylase